MLHPDEEPSARSQQVGDRLRPPADIRQPAQGADTGVHKVEPARTERRDGVVHLGLDEIHLRSDQRRYPPPLCQSCGREVQPGHACAEAGERDGVSADVALQMNAAQPGDVSEPRSIELHDVTQKGWVLHEARDMVAG
jgi:hypothetical protein